MTCPNHPSSIDISHNRCRVPSITYLQGVIHELTDKCWEVCMKDTKPGPRLEYKTQDCMRACVDRFIDANIMVSRRMGEKGQSLARAAARDSEELLS